jgi:hypothetical protein
MRKAEKDKKARNFRARVAARAKPLAKKIDALLEKILRRELGRILRNEFSKSDEEDEIARLIRTFGVRRAETTAHETVASLKGTWVRRPEVYRDFYKNKEIKIKEYLANSKSKLPGIVRRELLRAERRRKPEDPRLTPTVLTRNLFDKLRDKGDFSPARAELIARTEIAQAENFGIMEGLKLSNVDRIQWITITDDRAREDHIEMDGVIINVGEMFELPDGSRLRFPGDPSGPIEQIANCRCSVIPADPKEPIEATKA